MEFLQSLGEWIAPNETLLSGLAARWRCNMRMSIRTGLPLTG